MRRLACVLFGAAVLAFSTPGTAPAATVRIDFAGTTDPSTFGPIADPAPFSGSVVYDSNASPTSPGTFGDAILSFTAEVAGYAYSYAGDSFSSIGVAGSLQGMTLVANGLDGPVLGNSFGAGLILELWTDSPFFSETQLPTEIPAEALSATRFEIIFEEIGDPDGVDVVAGSLASFSTHIVPEPSSALLLGAGVLALTVGRRGRGQRQRGSRG